MKYYLINPAFIEAPIKITRIHALNRIEETLKETMLEVNNYILINVDNLIYKLVIKEIDREFIKFKLTSNIYI